MSTKATQFMESYRNLQRDIAREQFIQVKLYADECHRHQRDLEINVHLMTVDRCRAAGVFTRPVSDNEPGAVIL